jgi:type I restriction enzyme S subunit
MKWQAYPKYKDSGIEQLGQIPVHWEARRLKTVSRFAYGDSLAADNRVPDGYNVFGSNGIVGQHNMANTQGPCLIVGRKGSFGKVVYSERPCFAIDTTYFVDASQTSNHLRWLFYCLQWLRLDSYSKDSAVPGLAREDAYENLAPYCLPDEQRAIAAFLDHKTAHIDALIAKKERQIELFQEKRASPISKQIRYIAESLQTGPFGSQLHSSDYVTDGTPVINPSHMKDGHIEPDHKVAIDDETCERLARHKLCAGDIVFARRGELGRCALVTLAEEGWLCGTGSLRMRSKLELSYPPFLNRVLSTNGVSEWLLLQSVGSTMDNLNTSILSQLPLPIPPLNEQHVIAVHLDHEIAKLDALTAKVQESIERLQEYRTALISAAVTGKIDVRDEEDAAKVQRTF